MRIKTVIVAILSMQFAYCKVSTKGLPELKDFNILLVDSLTVFKTKDISKGKPFMIVYFDPDCKECQDETREIIENYISLKETPIYFVTDVPFERVKVFNLVFKIYEYPNFILGKDAENKFYNLYQPTGTPYSMIFDSDRKLRAVYSGQAPIKKVTDVLKKLK